MEYEYQLKASLKQQKMQEELLAQKEVLGRNQNFVQDLF